MESRDRQAAVDVVAAAIMVSLRARRVTILARSDHTWTLRGLAEEETTTGVPSVISDVADPPPNTLLRITPHPTEGGAWQLRAELGPDDEAREAPPEGVVGQVGMVGAGDGEHPVLVVVDRPAVEDLEQLLTVMAQIAASAVVSVDHMLQRRMRESLSEREDERRRWARELHDETLQQLGALQVLLTSVRQRRGPASGSDAAEVYAAMDQAAELVAGQIVSLRYLINELRPSALDELGLRPPLEALAERTERLTGVRVDMRVSLPYADGRVSTRLLPDIELAVYRVVQEALTNAVRHSHGHRVEIMVREETGRVLVEVSDDGTGARQLSGFGIDGMHERAALAGGRLEVIRHTPDDQHQGRTGTTVRMILPARHLDTADPAVTHHEDTDTPAQAAADAPGQDPAEDAVGERRWMRRGDGGADGEAPQD